MPTSAGREQTDSRMGRREFLHAGALVGAAGLLAAGAAGQSAPPGAAPKQPGDAGQAGSSTPVVDDPLIGYCGYNCGQCAGRSAEKAERLKMIAGWNKIFGHNYTPDKVPGSAPCCTCKGRGEVADQVCQARPCAREKGVSSCAACDSFPCAKMRGLVCDRNEALLALCRRGSVTRAEYDLCARQFESLPNLLAALVEKGKLPAWVKDYYLRG